eukprot:jgi/Picre1/31491/NNA_006843.t1
MLGGFKRVLNYCKRVDALAAKRAHMTVEELEEVDWRQSMEEEIVQQYKQVERVFGERLHAASQRAEHGYHTTEGGEENVEQYLVKWSGLPYADATWELQRT